MRRTFTPLLALCFVACSAGCASPDLRDERLPVLILSPGSSGMTAGDAAPPEDDASQRRAARLALRGIAPPDLEALNERLEELATQLESHLSPLGSDLADEPPEQAIRAVVAEHLPTITAARRLAAARWSFEGGTVRLAPSCRERSSEEEQCVSIHPADDPAAAGARFAAWPVTHAAFLRACATERQAVVERLRALTSRRQGSVALVLTADELARDDLAAERQVTERLSRIGRVVRRAERKDLAAMFAWADGPAPAHLLQGLALDPDQILVVPRLGWLARPAAFTAEIRSALSPLEGCVSWLLDPSAGESGRRGE